MKHLQFLCLIILLISISCRPSNDIEKLSTSTTSTTTRTPLSRSEIDSKIERSITETGNFHWIDTDALTIWSASYYGNQYVTIGYGTSKNDFKRGANSDRNKSDIISIVGINENTSKKDFLLYEDEYLNFIDVKIQNLSTIEMLLKNKEVRYIEPSQYVYKSEQQQSQKSSLSGFGCGYESSAVNSADQITVAPNAKVPWNFYKHNIPAAWNYSTGKNVGIAIIDTGISPNQSLMNSAFNNGYSTNRTVQKFGTYVNSIWPWVTTTDGVNDLCGHGSAMTSLATSPRNDKGYSVGVAYGANLISYRGTSDVMLESYQDQRGVSKALTAAGNRTDVKIISMSIGYLFSIGSVEDAVKYAYSKGKLIIAAGGTSTELTNNWVGVIFPANMPEVVAATGIKDLSTYEQCSDCHKGSEIDFTVVMQRSTDNNRTVPVLSYYDQQSDYVGGSSAATAITSGIAALVWSRFPTYNRDQVLEKMKKASQFYSSKNSNYGYGKIDVLKAVQ